MIQMPMPVSSDSTKIQIQIHNFGLHQVFFSKEMLCTPEFNYTEKMHIVPFRNEKGNIKGT